VDTDRSERLYRRALGLIPGGVNSPVRAMRSIGRDPIFIERGEGAELIDVDGNRYLDYVCSWGPLILGHADPDVVAAVREAVGRGTSYGAPTGGEIALAGEVTERFGSVEMVRMVNSGTEASMSALRLARAATGRDAVVKFAGCYHGHVDYLLVAAGSGLATFGQPSSQGVPSELAALTRVLPLDDPDAAEKLFAAEGARIAALIIEPVPANNGLLLQRLEFLKALRALCTKHGALLIFDEVISGFRLGSGGAAAHYSIKPDLATFGKVIGGGMPVGAFAGPRKIMQHLSPEGGVYQAGTLSGNPVAMTAGLTTLRVLQKEDGWKRLETLGAYLEQRLSSVLAEAPLDAKLVRLGSMFWIAWNAREAPRAAEALDANAAKVYASIFHSLLDQGIALAPSAFEIAFLSLAHTRRDIDRLAEGLRAALSTLEP
jgi:glutamate-1-semialdehyde 2,1-aminomutase